MEPWQGEAIRANIHKLVKLIKPDIGLLSLLEPSKILTDNELHSLKLTSKTPGEKVDELLKCLIMRRGAYKKLCIALEQDNQNGPAEILRQAERDHNAGLDEFQNSTGLMHEGCAFSKAGTSDPSNAFVANGLPKTQKKSSKRSNIHEQYNQAKDTVLHVVIDKPAVFPQELPEGSYELRSNRPGVALIINIMEFKCSSLKTRDGAEYDAKNMFKLWNGLGYKIFRENEDSWKKQTWTREEVLSTIKAFREYCRKRKPDSIVVFIGSHGKDNIIYTSDAPRKGLGHKEEETRKSFKLKEEIFSLFYDWECPELVGKPKVFLVNACQEFPNSIESDQVFDLGSPVSDMFIYISQAPGFASFRHPLYGSLFVHCLTFVIMKMAKESHMDEMIMEVTKILKERKVQFQDSSGKYFKYAHAPISTTAGITKLLYFPIHP